MSASSAALAAMLRAPASAQRSEVTEAPWSLDGLAGTLVGPRDPTRRGPAVLILAGSGPTDRDGNNLIGIRADTYRLIADALGHEGIRSLRYDKRGIGASQAKAAREEDLRFEHFVEDAAAAANDLARRPEISGVVLAGHSEGGLVALRAAGLAPVKGVVLLATPGRPFKDVLRAQFLAASMPEAARVEALRLLDRLSAGEFVTDVPALLAPLFRPSVQPYLASILTFDPANEFARLKTPALVVHGGRDLQIDELDFAALTKARPDARVVRLPEANHVLKQVPADLQANLAAYANPYLPLDPGLVPPIIEFVRSVAA